jgi:ABC-type uncharacterized transport system involved in gliding motility auxiliary subunit
MKNINNPVTPEDAALFSERIRHWQHVLGLHDWRIVVADKRSTRRRVMAEVFKIDLEQRTANIKLGSDWGAEAVTPQSIDELALHEVLHVFLHEFKVTCQVPEQDEDTLLSAEHRVVNILEQLLALIPGAR